MELIVINENKLKIMMNENDMHYYGLDENEFHCSIINTREILEKILRNSPIKTGFEDVLSTDKILMQLYPEKNGGCELYITKIAFDEMEDTTFMPEGKDTKCLLPKPTQKTPFISYKFENLEYAINAARELNNRSYVGPSSFYRDTDGRYVLFVDNQRKELSSISCLLSEFGEQVNGENTYLLLSERGKRIFKEGAVEELSKI